MDRILAVSVDGGHLVELHALVPRMGDDLTVDWVTFDTPQSRSLLARARVRFVPVIGAKDLRSLARGVPLAVRVLRARRYRHVVGSGSISLLFLPLARALGMGAHFMECATRTDGPSITGRILAAVPGVRTYTQHEAWAGGRWLYRGSVWDEFAAQAPPAPAPVRRVLVTVGMNPFPFRRLLERLLAVLPPDVEVTWQTGQTDTAGLPITARPMLPSHELDAEMRAADVIVAHAGTGSALQSLENGRIPLLVPRRAALGEQTDEHQPLLADELARRGLAAAAEVEDLTWERIAAAAGGTVRRLPDPPPFVLDELSC